MKTAKPTRGHMPPETDAIQHSSGRLIRRLARDYLARSQRRIALALGCMAVTAATQPALAWLMEPVVRDIFIARDAAMLMVVPLAVLAVMVIGGIANFGQAYTMNWVGLRVVADMQHDVFAHLMRLDLSYHQRVPTGQLVSRLTNDCNLVRQGAAATLTGLVKDLLTVVLLVSLMFYQNWELALVVLFVFPLAALPINKLGRRMRKVVTNTQAEIGQFTALLNESFQGARHVKAYGMEDYEVGRADRVIDRLFGLYLKNARTRALTAPLMETLGGIAIAAVIFYGGGQVIAGKAEAGAFFAFVTALLLAYRPLKSVANLNTVLQEGLAATQRVFTVLDIEPSIVDRPDAKPLRIGAGKVAFEGVRFGYDGTGDEARALNGLDLTVDAGRTVALVGPSGAGKSTVLNLIPRFFDVDDGRVLIDDQDVRDVTLSSLRAAIGLVSQEITLFDDTVCANIRYGRPDADDAAVEDAARAAAAHDFILALAHGYDTRVGENGVNLSGGERQRIAIARAMLKDAPILLLDEATAALDAESERYVQHALSRLTQGRTTLVIAHRLATVRSADWIYVIDRGQVVEQGTHATLVAQSGLYARLHSFQFSSDGDSGRPSASDSIAVAQG